MAEPLNPPNAGGGETSMSHTRDELQEALRAILSLLHKCEKASEKLEPGKSQHTLTARRIEALRISSDLIARELEKCEERVL